ncbi:hypothetical protein C8R43DRAFT_1053099 [Mycena crocata]|nr:hypothetical protein C8R43DRAFT_1053099 [Mycena crocata]
MSNGTSLEQVDILWFTNDTVILRADDSIFRVTQSILAARSSVFQSMFEFPRPGSDGDDLMDGIPIVRLHDSAADVKAFLRAIFDSSYFMPPPAKIDFHELLGILRLSHKYDVVYLYQRAIHHLETVYPLQEESYGTIHEHHTTYKDGIIDLDLIALPILHQVGATWLLPCAYYSIGTYKADELLGAGETWQNLPPDMKQTCILLHAPQSRAVTRLNAFLSEKSTCGCADTCNLVRWNHLRSRVTHRVNNEDQNPMLEWEATAWETLEHDLCDDCFAVAKTHFFEVRTEIWNELPANCGLESWDVLKESRRLALEG